MNSGKIMATAFLSVAILSSVFAAAFPGRPGPLDVSKLFRNAGTAAFCGRVLERDLTSLALGDTPVPATLGTSVCFPGASFDGAVDGRLTADGKDGVLTYAVTGIFGSATLAVATPRLSPEAEETLRKHLPGGEGGAWGFDRGRLMVACPDHGTKKQKKDL